jgi:hypothetical protein
MILESFRLLILFVVIVKAEQGIQLRLSRRLLLAR